MEITLPMRFKTRKQRIKHQYKWPQEFIDRLYPKEEQEKFMLNQINIKI